MGWGCSCQGQAYKYSPWLQEHTWSVRGLTSEGSPCRWVAEFHSFRGQGWISTSQLQCCCASQIQIHTWANLTSRIGNPGSVLLVLGPSCCLDSLMCLGDPCRIAKRERIQASLLSRWNHKSQDLAHLDLIYFPRISSPSNIKGICSFSPLSTPQDQAQRIQFLECFWISLPWSCPASQPFWKVWCKPVGLDWPFCQSVPIFSQY